MSHVVIRGVIRSGRIHVDAPIDLPEGSVVMITGPIVDLPRRLLDEDRELMPDEIAAALAAMDAIEPLEMTDAELAAWEAERRSRREREKARFASHAEELRGAWE
ncbi:hypothetical protein [Aquisphaera insulae]|uniref:hypothetical protein n=1 Tax=Aquisphaera insulae TaxID=2712864 RepID=UPI0013EA9571|nr:hypothetical protein [Aquisphaera insulae]